MTLTATEALNEVRKLASRWIAGSTTTTETMSGIVRVIMDVSVTPAESNEVELLKIIREKDALIASMRASRSGQAEAWGAVFNTLNEVTPEWLEGSGTTSSMEMAVRTIRKLKLAASRASVAAYPAKTVGADLCFAQTGRPEVVGQNGNDGLHYLPHGLLWEDAPDWATALVKQEDAGTYVWAERYVLEHEPEPLRARLAIRLPGAPEFSGFAIEFKPGHKWVLMAVRPEPDEQA